MQAHNAVVVGGGIAGLTAALNLAQRRIAVTLVERDSALGGRARTVCCKAIDGVCQTCGGCLLAPRLTAVSEHPGIQVRTSTTVQRMTPRPDGRFDLHLRSSRDPSERLSCDTLILATGFDHVDAHTKGPYGLSLLPAVITGEEVERRLVAEGQGAFDGLGLRRVAFVQCVGSRDEQAGRGYCSQVCCRYALRLARLLKARQPDLEITVFKMDIQFAGRDFRETWRKVSDAGIQFVAGLPAVIRRSTEDPARVTFLYDDILANSFRQADFDLVVLSTGIQPRAEARAVADQFGINLDDYGFFASKEGSGETIVPGLFVAGCCQAPRSMAESVAHAQIVAQRCYAYLQERFR
ncbi:MAG: CoB--CoM heterodisulfide reductase iron-sulfur subunit A family protein [Anaerolineae bacterium]|nr:CoB--CoM heterodisulfide reductase iron-sulfur subunit A family protein [Anaerolineae bacterium]